MQASVFACSCVWVCVPVNLHTRLCARALHSTSLCTCHPVLCVSLCVRARVCVRFQSVEWMPAEWLRLHSVPENLTKAVLSILRRHFKDWVEWNAPMQIHSFGVLKGQKYLQFEIKSCTKVNRSQVEILDNTTLAENLMMQRFIYQWIWRFSSYRYSIDFIIIEMTGLNFSYSVNNTVSVPVFHTFAYCQSKISFYFPVIIIGMHSKLHRSWPELQRQAGIQRAGAVVEGWGGNSCRWGHPGKQLLPPSPLPHSLSLSLTSHMHTHVHAMHS